MLKKERQTYILHQVNVHNRVLSADLSQQIKVSEDTIRRDLAELADQGKLIKVHGGALSQGYHLSVHAQEVYALDEKRSIAQKAAKLIQDGMFVLTTGGTTIIELAKALPPDLKATFFTVSLTAAIEYMQHPNIEIILIGDKLSKNAQITVGGEAQAKIKQIKPDLCFLGTNAIDITHGLTENDWEVMQIKKAMVTTAQKVVALTIAEKVNTAQRIQVCDVHRIHTLITELPPDNPLFTAYKDAGLEVI
ncbi:MAG TPA: DeoR/GlpR family DNA-binding transcription regulator [Chitinophaga sp.]|uniref:DeoR/GlpR family DNA-binding transcription regulator n=1 Tax=Chitinophaga sp. TaxID=1869181 RepID=UPI002DBD21C0|nr:DeoR/GlpR family DNA-binding transcription regulator [Chitinophaga sp.]HEU4553559.1 DeoR/GlpR family DNA-binding transcription regulator [Chitinophaga sp.]